MSFDINAIKDTHTFLGYKRKYLNKKIDLLCLWNFACKTFLSQKLFAYLAEKNNWKSEAGNYRTNAEVAYRYITGNYTFDEEHTALSDVLIEYDILKHCLRQKKKIPYNEINNHPWKIVNRGK